MFISRKRSTVLLLFIFFVSLWIIFQNLSLHKSLFTWTNTRTRQVAELQVGQIKTIHKNLKRVSFEFHPPPPFPGETQSEGYNVEDMYFRRWQVAHNVKPVRAVRERTEDKRWKGWSSHHFRGNLKPQAEDMYAALRRRQEDRLQEIEEMRRKNQQQRPRQRAEESVDDDQYEEGDGGGGDDVIDENNELSNFTAQRTWLKARLENFCNDRGVMRGDEGVAVDGYTLRTVFVVARHGDRTPLENSKTGKLAPFRWECNLAEGNKKVGSIHMERFLRVMRSTVKDIDMLDAETRSLITQIPMQNSHTACTPSQLTPKGWIQHMRLGDFLKKRYWHQLQLSADRGSPQGISIKSTMTTRTLQSSMAFLFGFLSKFTVFDISKIKFSEHTTFCTERNCHCGAVDKMRESVSSRYHAFHKVANITTLSRMVSRYMYTEEPLYSVPNPSRLIELLTARACHNSQLPCTENGCVNEAMFEQVFKTVDSISDRVRSEPNHAAELFGRLAMHPLLSSISLTMRYIDRGQSSLPKFYMYMGHDITVTPLLDALGLVYPWPGYASRVVMEHWRSTSQGSSALRILYNGVPVTHKVNFCIDKLNAAGLCPLDAFLQFIEKDNLKKFNAMTYDEACSWGI